MDSDFLPEKRFSFRQNARSDFFPDLKTNNICPSLALLQSAAKMGGEERKERETEWGGESENETGGFDTFCITCPETRGFDALTQREVLVWQVTGLPQDFHSRMYPLAPLLLVCASY